MPVPVAHRTIDLDGMRIFYREAGPPDGPAVLLPNGYPCSSYQFRDLMAVLGETWRLVAPDYPGFGYRDTPDRANFAYTFDACAEFLHRFTRVLELPRYVLYPHDDYGSQFDLRLAMAEPARVAGPIIENGDIYADQHGPKYAPLKEYRANPTLEGREKLRAAVSEEGFRDEFVGEVPEHLVERVPPDLRRLHWALMSTAERRENVTDLLADQGSTVPWFARQQAYLRQHRPPTLIVWGPHDGYMPEGAARAYLRDLPDAELHLLDAGHRALETSLEEVIPLVRSFLDRIHPPASAAKGTLE